MNAHAKLKTKEYSMTPASPGKSLYISITLGSAVCHPCPPSSCLSPLLACYQAGYNADGVPPFLIGWLKGAGA